jgi:hypothetical protein
MVARGRQRPRSSPRIVALVALAVLVAVAIARVQGAPSTSFGIRLARLRVRSATLHASLLVGLASPPGGGAGRPLLVVLPQDPTQPGTSLSRSLLAALAVLGRRAPDLAVPAGPADVYADATLARRWESYLLRRGIPTARARLGANPSRVTIGGIGPAAASAAILLDHESASFCPAPVGARLSLRQAQRDVDTDAFQRHSASAAVSAAVYDYLDAYARALAACSRSAAR